jgi:DNA-directed RNA polymerase specialized sigma24 family protein
MRIAHNLVIDYFRKNQRFPTIKTDENFDIFDVIDSREESIEHKLIKNQIHDDVRKLIRQLPEEQRRVLVLRHYSNLSFKEDIKIAADTVAEVPVVKPRLSVDVSDVVTTSLEAPNTPFMNMNSLFQ